MRIYLSPEFWMAIFGEALMYFGPASTWDTQEVAQWMKTRVDGLMAGQGRPPTVQPYQPKVFEDPVPDPPLDRWHELEDL